MNPRFKVWPLPHELRAIDAATRGLRVLDEVRDAFEGTPVAISDEHARNPGDSVDGGDPQAPRRPA
jgi:hypothetical protein